MDTGLVVSRDQQSDGGIKKRTFEWDHVPLRELEDIDPQNYETVVELFSQLGNQLGRKFLREDWSKSGVYIRNVIVTGDDRERTVLYNYLLEQGASFPRDLFGFSFDDDHVHIIHSCTPSSVTAGCKCLWKKKIPCGILRPGYIERQQLGQWGRNDFLSAIIYLFYKKGGHKEAWIKRGRQRIEDNRKYMNANGI